MRGRGGPYTAGMWGSSNAPSLRSGIEPLRTLRLIHYAGWPQDMPALKAFCAERGLLLVEDAAQALYGCDPARPIGTVADAAIVIGVGMALAATTARAASDVDVGGFHDQAIATTQQDLLGACLCVRAEEVDAVVWGADRKLRRKGMRIAAQHLRQDLLQNLVRLVAGLGDTQPHCGDEVREPRGITSGGGEVTVQACASLRETFWCRVVSGSHPPVGDLGHGMQPAVGPPASEPHLWGRRR